MRALKWGSSSRYSSNAFVFFTHLRRYESCKFEVMSLLPRFGSGSTKERRWSQRVVREYKTHLIGSQQSNRGFSCPILIFVDDNSSKLISTWNFDSFILIVFVSLFRQYFRKERLHDTSGMCQRRWITWCHSCHGSTMSRSVSNCFYFSNVLIDW